MGLMAWLRGARESASSLVLAGGGSRAAWSDGALSPNPYNTKRRQVEELIRKYRGEAEWGCQFIRRIIAVKASFVMPKGIGLKRAEHLPPDVDVSAEMDFLRAFLDWNRVNDTFAQDLIIQAELEGQAAVVLSWPAAPHLPQTPDLRYLSWFDTGYEVFPAGPADYSDFGYIEWEGSQGRQRIARERCEFVAFGNRKNSFEGYPPCGVILRECEDLDLALRQWRLINDFTARQTPVIEGVENQSEADRIAARIAKAGWKTGQLLVTSGQFRVVGPSGITVEMLEREIVRKLGLISGVSGVAPHYLGAPDLLANRATAQSLELPVEVVSQNELGRWVGFWNGVLDKAIGLRNQYVNPPLRPGVVRVQISRYSRQQMDDLKHVWLPLFEKGAITLREVRQRCPGVEEEGGVKRET